MTTCNWCQRMLSLQVRHLTCNCRLVNYCNKACQLSGWRAGHSKSCVYDQSKKPNQSFITPSVPKTGRLSTKPILSSESSSNKVERRVPHCSVNKGHQGGPNSGSSFSKPAYEVFDLNIEEIDVEREEEISLEPAPVMKERCRGEKGKFVPDEDLTEDEILLRKAATRQVKNNRDFGLAKTKLQSIIDRNALAGVKWAFAIDCKKSTKFSKYKAHNWKSENFENVVVEEGPALPCKRVCVNCKGSISGPHWGYLVCRGRSCHEMMTHYACIGFPNVSEDLARRMKNQYECASCFEHREVLEREEADFRENQTQNQNRYRKLIKKKNQRGVKTNLEQQRGLDNGAAQPVSVQPQPDPMQHQPDPMQHRPDPVQHQPDPVQHQPGPVQHQPGPVQHQPGPVQHQPGHHLIKVNLKQNQKIVMTEQMNNNALKAISEAKKHNTKSRKRKKKVGLPNPNGQSDEDFII